MSYFRQFGHFGPKMVYTTSTLDLISGFFFFLILHNKMGQILHQNFIVFLIKSFIWGNLILLGHFLLFDWMWSKSSQFTVTIRYLNSLGMISCMITTGSLSSHDMIRILKQLGHDFSVKRLCYGCCVDTM